MNNMHHNGFSKVIDILISALMFEAVMQNVPVMTST